MAYKPELRKHYTAALKQYLANCMDYEYYTDDEENVYICHKLVNPEAEGSMGVPISWETLEQMVITPTSKDTRG